MANDFQPKPRTLYEQTQARVGQLKQERASFISHYQDINRVLLPRNGRFFVEDRNRGDKRHNNILDSTGTRAQRVLSAGLMGGATSPARPWFRFETPDKEMMKRPAVKEWLNTCTRIALDIMQLSNTYRMFHQMYDELGGFGTGAAIMVDDFKYVVHNHTLTVGEYMIAQNFRGEVNTLYREFQKTVGEIVPEFGYENCSKTVQSLYNQGKLETWVTLTHGIEPRTNRDAKMRDAKNMAWRSVYIETGRDNDKVLQESGFKKFRGVCPRWSVTGGDIYGTNCPGMEALGDIKQLQHEQLRKAEGIDFKTKPPLQAPSSMKERKVERMPGGMSYYDSTGPSAGIKTLFEVNLDLDHLLQDIQDVRERINAAFYANLFQSITDMDKNATAMEVARRHEEQLLQLGPVLERLHNELFAPVVTLVFERMLELRGPGNVFVIPPAPEELHGAQLNIEFISMLAQAQRAVSTNSVDRFVIGIGQIAAFKPGVLDKFDEDKWADIYADALGVDPELVVGDDKVALVRKQRQEQQQKQAQMEQISQGADAAKKLAQSPTTGGNALTDITNGFSGYSTPQSPPQ